MSVLVTGAEVKEIINTSLTETEVEVYITAAVQIVDAVCTNNTDEVNKEVQRWLSAHFIQINNQNQSVASEKADVVGRNFQYKVDLFLKQTRYGQMAVTLDTSGDLARYQQQMEEGNIPQASMAWIGGDE